MSRIITVIILTFSEWGYLKLFCRQVGLRQSHGGNLWKETSVLSLFRPSFWPGPVCTAWHSSGCWRLVCLYVSSFWLLQISACFLSQPFLLTLLYLTDIFRWSCQWGLHFSTLYFNVLDRMQTTVNQSLAFSCALTHAVCNIAQWVCYFSVCLELV